MNKLKTVAHNLRSTEASEIAEAAVVLPLVFMFLLGIVWFGRAFNIYSTIQQAAQQGALAAARPTCSSSKKPGGRRVSLKFLESLRDLSHCARLEARRACQKLAPGVSPGFPAPFITPRRGGRTLRANL